MEEMRRIFFRMEKTVKEIFLRIKTGTLSNFEY